MERTVEFIELVRVKHSSYDFEHIQKLSSQKEK